MSIIQSIESNNSQVENQLLKVIDNCKNIVEENNTILKIKASNNKAHNDKLFKDITLEKVAKDMALVLCNLKNGIKLVKAMKHVDTDDDVSVEIEKIYKKQESISTSIVKQDEDKTTKTGNKSGIKKTTASNKKNQNQPKNSKNPDTQSKRASIIDNKVTGSKVVVTTVTFPRENDGNKNSPLSDRPNSTPQPGLKKASTINNSSRRSVSMPPSRNIYNPLGIIKDEVERAKRENKTFTIRGQYPAIRRALLKRGWVEKFHPSYKEKLSQDIRKFYFMDIGELVDLLRNKEIAQSVKAMIKSKLLKDHQVDLYWDHSFDVFTECPDTKKLTLINRFRRESYSYTSKQGLCQAARDAHWLHIPGVAKINHPRCYTLSKGGDTKFFVKDFGLTAAISLLKWIIKSNITGECKVISSSGKIPFKYFDFAITECYKFTKRMKHQDIDEDIRDAMELEWNDFLQQYYKAVHVGNHFKLANSEDDPVEVAKSMVRKTNYLLNEVRSHMPCFDMDGYMNIWILKPTNGSRGQGIHICRTLQYILDVIRKNPNRRYIIQKYIERPLLIHDTKFDIRQWFLVSCSRPLTIWIYRLCYLRFSSQTYNLRNLHESIHLTNNSVQSKYNQKGSRDALLPSYGMWDSKEFKNYLSNIGYPNIFEDTIYPGMRECITGAMLAHRDKIEKRKNCFEMYGADFMLTETFEPWLLEINSNPALHPSTPITSKMCPEVLEDVIKVVVDNARNNKASTGHFELIYKENLENQTANTKAKFELNGIPIPEDYFCEIQEKHNSKQEMQNFSPPDPSNVLLKTGENMKNALRNLLRIIKYEKSRKRSRKEQSVNAISVADTNSSTQTKPEVVSIYQSPLTEIHQRLQSADCILNKNNDSLEEPQDN